MHTAWKTNEKGGEPKIIKWIKSMLLSHAWNVQKTNKITF
jgi:hypothetical protein